MKRALAMVLITFVIAGAGFAQSEGIGVGLEFDGGIQLSGKYWMNNTTGIAGTLNGAGLSADYLLHNYGLIELDKIQTPVHYGAGLGVSFSEDAEGKTEVNLGVRVPVGMSFYLKKQPIDIYWSLVPGINMNGFNFGLGYEWGIRYFF